MGWQKRTKEGIQPCPAHKDHQNSVQVSTLKQMEETKPKRNKVMKAELPGPVEKKIKKQRETKPLLRSTAEGLECEDRERALITAPLYRFPFIT